METGEERGAGGGELVWSAERVVRWLEGVTRRGAHQLRLAHWLCRLAESSLAWKENEENGGAARLLLFSRGRIVERGYLAPDTAPPVPPGAAAPPYACGGAASIWPPLTGEGAHG